MKLMKILDDESVVPADVLYLDGYGFGDRMLEGLLVKITEFDGVISASADWPKGVNSEYWTERAVEYAINQDVLSTSPDLNNDDGFILSEHGQD